MIRFFKLNNFTNLLGILLLTLSTTACGATSNEVSTASGTLPHGHRTSNKGETDSKKAGARPRSSAEPSFEEPDSAEGQSPRSPDRMRYFADTASGLIEFEAYEVPGDGDCGYHSLGITRREALTNLRQWLAHPVIRKAYAGEILSDLADGCFSAHGEEVEYSADWIPSENLTRRYFSEKVRRQWMAVGLNSELLKEKNPDIYKSPQRHEPGATMEAIALVEELNVRVWVLEPKNKKRNQIKLAALFAYGGDKKFIDILNIGNLHFSPLAQKGDLATAARLLQRETDLASPATPSPRSRHRLPHTYPNSAYPNSSTFPSSPFLSGPTLPFF